jgi:Lipocalin-like domain
MKKTLFLLVILLQSFIGSSQNSFDKKLIIKKWKIDLEAMKPVVEKMLSENEQMSTLDELNKKVAVTTALNQISAMAIEYKSDGVLLNTTSKGDTTGTWKWDGDSNTILTKTNDKPEKKFTVITLSEKKLHLKTAENKDLHLMSN